MTLGLNQSVINEKTFKNLDILSMGSTSQLSMIQNEDKSEIKSLQNLLTEQLKQHADLKIQNAEFEERY